MRARVRERAERKIEHAELTSDRRSGERLTEPIGERAVAEREMTQGREALALEDRREIAEGACAESVAEPQLEFLELRPRLRRARSDRRKRLTLEGRGLDDELPQCGQLETADRHRAA